MVAARETPSLAPSLAPPQQPYSPNGQQPPASTTLYTFTVLAPEKEWATPPPATAAIIPAPAAAAPSSEGTSDADSPPPAAAVAAAAETPPLPPPSKGTDTEKGALLRQVAASFRLI